MAYAVLHPPISPEWGHLWRTAGAPDPRCPHRADNTVTPSLPICKNCNGAVGHGVHSLIGTESLWGLFQHRDIPHSNKGFGGALNQAIFMNSLWGWHYYPHFTGKVIDAQWLGDLPKAPQLVNGRAGIWTTWTRKQARCSFSVKSKVVQF